MLARGWYLLYPHFAHHASFSTNYFERGIHSVAEGQEPSISNDLRGRPDYRFTVPLLQSNEYRHLLPQITAGLVANVPWVNLFHKRVENRAKLFMNPKMFLHEDQNQLGTLLA